MPLLSPQHPLSNLAPAAGFFPRFAACAALALLSATLSAQDAAPGNKPPVKAEGATLQLDPFNVTGMPTGRYMASNSVSGTALNMMLKDVPMTINVITSEFIEDAVLGDFARTLDFNTSISQPSRGEVTNRGGLLAIRGFRNRNLLLDGVLASDFLPTELIDRIEVVKGPNTLYGQSDPGGLVNVISKRPLGRNAATASLKYGGWDTREGEVDVNVASASKVLNVRVLGSRAQTEGWRWLDNSISNFGAVMADWQPASQTKVRMIFGGNSKKGAPSNRATYPFMQVPTDLNGDGDFADTVGGVPEANVRYNNNFVPREWTSQAKNDFLDQHGTYGQGTVTQKIGSNVDLIYLFAQTDQTTATNFREFNTFAVNGVNAANHTTESHFTKTNAHTLNASIKLETGPINHSILLGARHTKDRNYDVSYTLRPTVPAEKAVLDAMNAGGRNIRYQITPADIYNHVPLWQDDVPTMAEIVAAGFRASQTGNIFQEITTFYLSDSAAMLNDRLRILGGVRNIEIVDYAYQINGTGGAKRKSRNTSYQLGANYALNDHLVLFANQATAFNPNGIDRLTGNYYSPETSKAWEAGLKIDRLFSDRVSGSVSYFHIDKKNVVRSDYNPFTLVNDTEVTDDQSKGVDLELFIDLTKNWQTTFGYSHVDAKTVRSATLALGLPLEGAMPNKYSFFTSYQITTGALAGLRFGGGGFVVQGPVQQFGTSNNRYVLEDGYAEFSAFARYTCKQFGKNVTYGVNVSNLTNEFYIRARANTNDPRKVMFSVKLDL